MGRLHTMHFTKAVFTAKIKVKYAVSAFWSHPIDKYPVKIAIWCIPACRELPIFTTKAHVFQIDPDTKKKWLPLSTTAVTVAYYHDSARHLYRIISVDGTKVLINSTLTANMTFTKTSQKFGQWSDVKANTVYGLGFSSEDELLKFMEKFDEVKTMSVQSSLGEKSTSVEPASSPRPPRQNDSAGQNPTDDLGDQMEQLRYENDRLKVALTQSSANAKKWETELQTLRNNNARLSAALQESATNVDQWKKQLQTYQEENARLHLQLTSTRPSDGADVLQRQLDDALEKLAITEHELLERKRELEDQKVLVEQLKPLKMVNQRLEAKVQALDDDNNRLQQELIQSSAVKHKEDRLKLLQQQFGAKLNELYVMNDSMAELLQSPK